MTPITHESLIAAGWKRMGGAYYGPANKKLTHFENAWQKWINGVSVTVITMNEL